MPAAIRVVTRLQDQDDIAAAPSGAGDTGKVYAWNNATSSFELTTPFTQSDADALYYPLASGNSLSSTVTSLSSTVTAHTSDATLHRVINDSSTASTVLWSGSKINTELATKGVGDFLANGSVAMAGSLNLADQVITSDDDDTKHLVGQCAIGDLIGITGYASFAQRDFASLSNYAFLQGPSGQTSFNAATGQNLQLKNGNTAKMTINSSGTTLNDTLDASIYPITSDDIDREHFLGRASIGYDGTNSDFAAFAHRDSMSGSEYAICQNASGATFINAASGQSVSLRIANTERARLASNGYLGINTTSPDRHLHVVDSAVASALYGGDIQAVFENNGNSGIQIVSSTTGTGSVMFGDTGGGEVGKIFYDHTNDRFGFKVGNANMLFMDQYYFEPATDNQVGIGRSGVRFTDVWSVDGTINTSDARDKQDIEPTELGLDFIADLRPVSYRWKTGAGTDKTRHGFIAQEVREMLSERGMNEKDFAGYVDGGVRLGLQYTEFIAPLVKAVQELANRVEELENGV